jgi:hypothetical protein
MLTGALRNVLPGNALCSMQGRAGPEHAAGCRPAAAAAFKAPPAASPPQAPGPGGPPAGWPPPPRCAAHADCRRTASRTAGGPRAGAGQAEQLAALVRPTAPPCTAPPLSCHAPSTAPAWARYRCTAVRTPHLVQGVQGVVGADPQHAQEPLKVNLIRIWVKGGGAATEASECKLLDAPQNQGKGPRVPAPIAARQPGSGRRAPPSRAALAVPLAHRCLAPGSGTRPRQQRSRKSTHQHTRVGGTKNSKSRRPPAYPASTSASSTA